MKKLFVPTVDISYSHVSKISVPRLSNHFQNYPSLHSTAFILVLVLFHFYYCSHLLTRYLSSSSASTLSQMFYNTDTWIFSHHYYQGLSPSEGLVVNTAAVTNLSDLADHRLATSAPKVKSVITNLLDLTDNRWLATTVLQHLGTCFIRISTPKSFYSFLILYYSLAWSLPLPEEQEIIFEQSLEDSFPFPFLEPQNSSLLTTVPDITCLLWKFSQVPRKRIIFLMTCNLNCLAQFKPTPYLSQAFVAKLFECMHMFYFALIIHTAIHLLSK